MDFLWIHQITMEDAGWRICSSNDGSLVILERWNCDKIVIYVTYVHGMSSGLSYKGYTAVYFENLYLYGEFGPYNIGKMFVESIK